MVSIGEGGRCAVQWMCVEPSFVFNARSLVNDKHDVPELEIVVLNVLRQLLK